MFAGLFFIIFFNDLKIDNAPTGQNGPPPKIGAIFRNKNIFYKNPCLAYFFSRRQNLEIKCELKKCHNRDTSPVIKIIVTNEIFLFINIRLVAENSPARPLILGMTVLPHALVSVNANDDESSETSVRK